MTKRRTKDTTVKEKTRGSAMYKTLSQRTRTRELTKSRVTLELECVMGAVKMAQREYRNTKLKNVSCVEEILFDTLFSLNRSNLLKLLTPHMLGSLLLFEVPC